MARIGQVPPGRAHATGEVGVVDVGREAEELHAGRAALELRSPARPQTVEGVLECLSPQQRGGLLPEPGGQGIAPDHDGVGPREQIGR